MILTPSDVASLARVLLFWEIAEYSFGVLVALACFGEYTADFTNWFTGGVEERKKCLAKASTLLLIASLALELICLVRTNQISGELVGSLDSKAEEAYRKASAAVTDSDTAMGKAKTAVDTAGSAKIESLKANDSAAKAEALARGARQEADSFEKAIKEAKSDAAEAKALLTDVRKLAAEAQQRSADAKRIAGEEQLIRRQNDERVAPLDTQETAALLLALIPFPTFRIDIWQPNDRSGALLANSIAGVLGGGVRWQVRGFQSFSPTMIRGIIVEFNPKYPKALEAAKALTRALPSRLDVKGPVPSLPKIDSGYGSAGTGRPDGPLRVTIGQK